MATCLYLETTLALLPVLVAKRCDFNAFIPKAFELLSRTFAFHLDCEFCVSIAHVDNETACFADFVHNLQQGTLLAGAAGFSASKEKQASSTNVTSASTVSVQRRLSDSKAAALGGYLIRVQIPSFSPAAGALRNTCSNIRLNAMPTSGQPCLLPRFVQTTESSLLGISLKHTIQLDV